MSDEDFDKLHARVRALEVSTVMNLLIDGMNRGVKDIQALGNMRKEILHSLAAQTEDDDAFADALRQIGDLTTKLTDLVPINWQDPKPEDDQDQPSPQ